jgi:rod shape-determining protein MreC
MNLSQSVQGLFSENLGGIRQYLALSQTNMELSRENTLLRNQLDELERQHEDSPVLRRDSIPGRMFSYIPASVINVSTNKQFNFITLNKGRLHGIEPEMAVISTEGVVGIVYQVSGNYSTVIPLINRDFRLSSKIRRNGYYGSLSWPGEDYRQAILEEIPFHVEIRPTDTIVTSGFSAIFPEGIPVGTVRDYVVIEGNFYTITVDIEVDYKKLYHVNVVQNLLREEQLELERISGND